MRFTKTEKTALLAVLVNFLLTVGKFALAGMTLSVALLAEAYHSLSDIFSSILLFLALYSDRKGKKTKRQRRFRFFSRADWENKVTIFIGIVLLFVGVGVLKKVIFVPVFELRYPVYGAVAMVLLAAFSYVLYRFETNFGTKYNSTGLIADGRHARADMMISLLVAGSLLAHRMGLPLDRVMGGLVGFLILADSVRVIKSGLRSYLSRKKTKAAAGTLVLEDLVFIKITNWIKYIAAGASALWRRFPWHRLSLRSLARRGLIIVSIISVAWYLLSGVFVLQPYEKAIVERFGRPLDPETPLGPGIHYRLPYPFEIERRAHTEVISNFDIGYARTPSADDMILWTNVHYMVEYSVLTGEYSMLDITMKVHYRISKLKDYFYSSMNPESYAQRISYWAVQRIFSRRDFFSSITSERDTLEDQIKSVIQAEIDKHKLGLLITAICLRDLHPPTEIAPAFEDVVSAQEDHQTYVEKARAYGKDGLPRARGEAAVTVQSARADKVAAVKRAAGEADACIRRVKVYRRSPAVTRERLLLENLESVLPPVEKYILYPRFGADDPGLWFHLLPAGGETFYGEGR